MSKSTCNYCSKGKEKGRKSRKARTPPKRSYSKILRRTQIRWVIWLSSSSMKGPSRETISITPKCQMAMKWPVILVLLDMLRQFKNKLYIYTTSEALKPPHMLLRPRELQSAPPEVPIGSLYQIQPSMSVINYRHWPSLELFGKSLASRVFAASGGPNYRHPVYRTEVFGGGVFSRQFFTDLR